MEAERELGATTFCLVLVFEAREYLCNLNAFNFMQPLSLHFAYHYGHLLLYLFTDKNMTILKAETT